MKHLYKLKSQRGFTIVELLVTMAVSTIIIITMVATISVFGQQLSISLVRQNLNTDAQAAISVVNDDIRNSIAVSLYNVNPDSNAPSSPLAAPYSDVAGNPESNDPSYNWRMSGSRLILMQPVRDANNNPVYTDPATLTGNVNIVVYYVKNATLYRRLIAGPGNQTATFNCAVEPGGGCTTGVRSDQKIVSDLNTSNGVGSFGLNYLDVNRVPISIGVDGSGNPDYSGFTNTRIIAASIKLGKTQAGEPLVDERGAITQLRATSINQTTQKPLFNASLSVGPGGITMSTFAQIFGQTVSTQGPITIRYNSIIGTNSQPSYVTTANKACGTGSAYGTTACTTDPVILSNGSRIGGNLCASGQSSAPGSPDSFVEPGLAGTQYTKGFIAGCSVAPDVTFPAIDKTSYVATMTASKQGSQASCNGLVGTTSILEANTKYTTNDVSLQYGCSAEIQGNVYIQGSLNMSFGATLRVKNGITKRPMVVLNGGINFLSNVKIVANDKGIAPYFVTFDSSNACSTTDTSCGTFSQADKQNSANRSSIRITYGATAPSSLFYAVYGGADLLFNGTISMGSLSAQRVGAGNASKLVLDQ